MKEEFYIYSFLETGGTPCHRGSYKERTDMIRRWKRGRADIAQSFY